MNCTKLKIAFCLFTMCVLSVGCSTESQHANSKHAQSLEEQLAAVSQPNLSLHKPKTFSSAITRLKELNDSLLADGDFPEPITVKYVEVIHGQGPSGHSHYYTAESYEANGGPDEHDEEMGGHDAEEETVKHRSVEVDLRTELSDIVGWLPDIAAKENLDESQWNSVHLISDRLAEMLDAIPADASDDSFRESWRMKSKEIEPLLDELQTQVGASSGDAR